VQRSNVINVIKSAPDIEMSGAFVFANVSERVSGRR